LTGRWREFRHAVFWGYSSSFHDFSQSWRVHQLDQACFFPNPHQLFIRPIILTLQLLTAINGHLPPIRTTYRGFRCCLRHAHTPLSVCSVTLRTQRSCLRHAHTPLSVCSVALRTQRSCNILAYKKQNPYYSSRLGHKKSILFQNTWLKKGHEVAQWLRLYATSRKVAGSRPMR
jgi:hypothetical protein